jgi:SAM-dependent methyltransferase
MNERLEAVAEKMRAKVAGILAIWLEGVTHIDFQEVAATHLSVDHVREKVAVIERYLPGFLQPDKKILEIGCGFGAFTVFCRALYNYDTTAVEPDPLVRAHALELASLAGVDCRIEACAGENLFFPDAAFDFVYSSNVLEHVQDPARVLAESVRVLKPGGYLFFTYPNYCSFWEGHYGILWLPCLPGPLAKIYVRLLGRNSGYIDSLQLVNVAFTEKILEPLLDKVTVISLGDDLWEQRMEDLKFGEWGAASKLKGVLTLVHKIPFIMDLGIKLGKWMKWYYPITLILRKKDVD